MNFTLLLSTLLFVWLPIDAKDCYIHGKKWILTENNTASFCEEASGSCLTGRYWNENGMWNLDLSGKLYTNQEPILCKEGKLFSSLFCQYRKQGQEVRTICTGSVITAEISSPSAAEAAAGQIQNSEAFKDHVSFTRNADGKICPVSGGSRIGETIVQGLAPIFGLIVGKK